MVAGQNAVLDQAADHMVGYLYTIIGSNVVAVIAVGALVGTFWRTAARLDRRIDNDKADADADRRAFHSGMDEFRREMQRLAERPSNVA